MQEIETNQAYHNINLSVTQDKSIMHNGGTHSCF